MRLQQASYYYYFIIIQELPNINHILSDRSTKKIHNTLTKITKKNNAVPIIFTSSDTNTPINTAMSTINKFNNCIIVFFMWQNAFVPADVVIITDTA